MNDSSDPSTHRLREQQFIQHVQRLLDDERLRVDTARGRRPVVELLREVNRSDRGVELKRLMADSGLPDRELEARMPKGEVVDVLLGRRRWLLLRQPVGRMRAVCVSPSAALLHGQAAPPLTTGQVQKALAEIPPPLKGVPNTVVLMSTSGFAPETHELAERRADRTLILVEPNAAGGWSAWGPPETRALTDLFDPEAQEEKRQRLHQAIDESRGDLLGGGLSGERLANRTQLPLPWIEAELRQYARENAGLTAKRLDGKVVLFPEGSAPAAAAATGGSDMPLLDRIRSLFSRKGENEKKIAFLSERRAALGQQRDAAYEDMATLESKDVELRGQFKGTTAPLTRRRITSQLLQLRKDMERRQQLLGVLNQQIDVVSTHLHNLELVQQGQSAKLPDSEELTSDAVAAEEMLAQLQADSELAGSVATTGGAGLTDEEQALYEELEAESGAAAPAVATEPDRAAAPQAPQTPSQATAQRAGSPPPLREPRRGEPEAG